MSLFPGGTFDKDYNSRYQEIKFSPPASAKKVMHPNLLLLLKTIAFRSSKDGLPVKTEKYISLKIVYIELGDQII